MRKFIAKVNGNCYEVEITEVEDQKVPSLEEKKKETVFKTENNGFNTSEKTEKVQLDDMKDLVPVVAPIPGLVLSINVKVGQQVKEGDILCILEAMKMENEISSPKSGIVKEIKIQTGERVSTSELMFRIQ